MMRLLALAAVAFLIGCTDAPGSDSAGDDAGSDGASDGAGSGGDGSTGQQVPDASGTDTRDPSPTTDAEAAQHWADGRLAATAAWWDGEFWHVERHIDALSPRLGAAYQDGQPIGPLQVHVAGAPVTIPQVTPIAWSVTADEGIPLEHWILEPSS